MLRLAQSLPPSVQEEYQESIVWAILFLFAVALLFVISKFIKQMTANRVRNTEIPFAMTTTDLDRMKDAGQLTDEEIAAIRRTMARNLLERTQQEARAREEERKEKRQSASLEDQIRGKSIAALAKDAAAPNPPARAPLQAPATPSPRSPVQEELPENLRQHLHRDDLELEQLRNAGFLTPEELRAIQRVREQGR